MSVWPSSALNDVGVTFRRVTFREIVQALALCPVQLETQLAAEAFGTVIHVHFAVQLARQALLDQARAEASAQRRLYGGTVALLPDERDPAVGGQAPGDVDPAAVARQRPVLHRVGTQFVQGHGEAQGVR